MVKNSFKTEIKYSGMIPDENLYFGNHVYYILDKIKKNL